MKADQNLNTPITIIIRLDEMAAGYVIPKFSSGNGGQEGGVEGLIEDKEDKGEKNRGQLFAKETLASRSRSSPAPGAV